MEIKKHLLVCVNERDPSVPKGCCASRGGGVLFKALRSGVEARKLEGIVVTRSYCLGPCEQGANLVIYPEGVWYRSVTLDDVDDIIDQHLLHGRPLERLINSSVKLSR